jgi:hypothetical protein
MRLSPGFQQIAYVDTETGELQERRIRHREEVEASGHARWFERRQQKSSIAISQRKG